MKIVALLFVFLMAACSGYKTPTLSDPSKMSEDTLCYRYAYAKKNVAIKEEVRARNLDCEENLQRQVPVGESRY